MRRVGQEGERAEREGRDELTNEERRVRAEREGQGATARRRVRVGVRMVMRVHEVTVPGIAGCRYAPPPARRPAGPQGRARKNKENATCLDDSKVVSP